MMTKEVVRNGDQVPFSDKHNKTAPGSVDVNRGAATYWHSERLTFGKTDGSSQ